jgi:hypothetical protein
MKKKIYESKTTWGVLAIIAVTTAAVAGYIPAETAQQVIPVLLGGTVLATRVALK